MARSYRLGRRQPTVDRTRASILAAARHLLADRSSHEISAGAIARQAGVSRLTVYNHFGSRAGVFGALAGWPMTPARPADPGLGPREAVRLRLAEACRRWSSDTALHRHLAPSGDAGEAETDGVLVERLAAADQLRPGCSIKEAEDVIAAITSFPVFDRLHKDGRRSPAAVAEILMRLAGAILA